MTMFRNILYHRIFPGFNFLFGVTSLIFLLAVVSNVPLLQFLSFGYLLESAGRLGSGQRFSQAIPGRQQAARVTTIILCVWLLLLPIRIIAGFWFDAWLIDSSSDQTRFLRFLQVLMTVIALPWIAVALVKGGTLRAFLWPVSLALTKLNQLRIRLTRLIFRRSTLNGSPGVTQTDEQTTWSSRISADYIHVRDQVYEFVVGLHLGRLLRIGFLGVIGTLLWLIVPMTLLVAASQPVVNASVNGNGTPGLTAFLAVLLAVPVFTLLPFLQVHFAVDGKLGKFLQFRTVWRNFGRAPLSHVLALLLTFALALPLFLLKIETVPPEFFWIFSVVFVTFIWPAKMICGWAYWRGQHRRGQQKSDLAKWWLRVPAYVTATGLSLTMIGILFFSRYVLWNGSDTLFENHIFLMPTPFWL